MKKIKSILLILLVFVPGFVYAYSKYIIPGGENLAIELNWDGVLVVGFYDINNISPSKDAGIKIGDIITKVNDNKISKINDLVTEINNSNSETIKITYIRNNKEYNTNLKLIKENDTLKTGLYIKDSITGIGTLTYIDPETKLYGALGHEIIESNTGVMLEVKNGSIYDSLVTGIDRSSSGNPGSKIAELKLDNKKGTIFENTNKGIFGNYLNELPNKKLYEVANINDIKLGEASIYTVINGNEIKEYKINILKINKNDTKNLLFEITDTELLENTGGIIQGMSGSPIIQGNYIIGAVTHVVIDSPNKGYGIFITKMLEEAEN